MPRGYTHTATAEYEDQLKVTFYHFGDAPSFELGDDSGSCVFARAAGPSSRSRSPTAGAEDEHACLSMDDVADSEELLESPRVELEHFLNEGSAPSIASTVSAGSTVSPSARAAAGCSRNSPEQAPTVYLGGGATRVQVEVHVDGCMHVLNVDRKVSFEEFRALAGLEHAVSLPRRFRAGFGVARG